MQFAFVSGDSALDLTGTVQKRRTLVQDLLAEPQDFARWVEESGLLDHRIQVRPWEFTAALELREALYRLALATAGRRELDPDDCGIVNDLAAGLPVRRRLNPDGTATRAGDAAAVLASLARRGVELLAGPSAARIKECAADGCTRLYLDGSKTGSRRWCDMRRCGNRAKVAEFRARRAG
ncbi:ABATE domain-containing protein [Kitasatospora sp. NBC_00315]|uniref:CGNR zinc finger domain-containing protein n=1 Tax=Kitasatospora sp. NBC_00315 TaxID=2975963 RepID=UPI003252480E